MRSMGLVVEQIYPRVYAFKNQMCICRRRFERVIAIYFVNITFEVLGIIKIDKVCFVKHESITCQCCVN